MVYEEELKWAKHAIRKSSLLAESVYRVFSMDVMEKSDASPVTIADLGCQALVQMLIHQKYPTDGFISEEESSTIFKWNSSTLDRLVDLVCNILDDPSIRRDHLVQAIDLNKSARKTDRVWILDPIDGTKGFIRGDQYCICLSLMDRMQPVLGILACPRLPFPDLSSLSTGSLIYGIRGSGAFHMPLATEDPDVRIRVSSIDNARQSVVCQGVDKSHLNTRQDRVIQSLGAASLVEMDSQCKYGLIARGEANIYLRWSPPNYVEKIWDHIAGCLIVQEAGGHVTDLRGNNLDFSLGCHLSSNQGIVVTNNNNIHSTILRVIRNVDNQ